MNELMSKITTLDGVLSRFNEDESISELYVGNRFVSSVLIPKNGSGYSKALACMMVGEPATHGDWMEMIQRFADRNSAAISSPKLKAAI